MASDRINWIELRNALFAGFFQFDPQIQCNCSDAKSTLCFSLYSVSLKLDKNKRSGELIRGTDRMILFSAPSSISPDSPFNSSVHQYDWSHGTGYSSFLQECNLSIVFHLSKRNVFFGIFLFLFVSCSCSLCFIYTLLRLDSCGWHFPCFCWDSLCLLAPEMIIPDLLEKFTIASESLTEPHRFHVCIQVRPLLVAGWLYGSAPYYKAAVVGSNPVPLSPRQILSVPRWVATGYSTAWAGLWGTGDVHK